MTLALAITFLFIQISFFTTTSNAFFVVNCTILALKQWDPIVYPGMMSNHAHVIAGAGNFSPNSTNDSIKQASCSSCDTVGDQSAYWVPQLYVAPPDLQDNSQESLQMKAMPVPLNSGKSFRIYYRLFTAKGERMTNDLTNWEPIRAFPNGFRMVVPEMKVLNKTLQAKSFNERVFNYKCYMDPSIPDNMTYTDDPNTCVDQLGLRIKLTTPSCWDGVHLDTVDHSSHVEYPTGAYYSSPCPSTHPVRLPTLFYEVSFYLPQVRYLLKQGWKLVFPKMPNQIMPTTNSPVFHGDFLSGWDEGFLQNLLNQCGVAPCPIISNQTVCGMM